MFAMFHCAIPFILAALSALPPEPLDFNLRDAAGRSHRLDDFRDSPVVVVVFLGAECPLAKLYAPVLVDLHKTFRTQSVAFIAVGSNQQDSLADLHRYAQENDLSFPFVKDTGNIVADRFGAKRTPEAFVLDKARHIRYRGRIDDQNAIGQHRAKATQSELRDAIEALLAGREVPVSETAAVGCPISRVRHSSTAAASKTYCKDIAPILQRHCQACHRPGQAGPFSLLDFEDAKSWAEAIRENVSAGRMPPWSVDKRSVRFANDPSLSDADKATLFAWIDADCPEGDRRDMPPPATFAESWRIGQPDRIVSLPKPVSVPAQGIIEYQYFRVDPGFKDDVWVTAAEILPSNPAVVHHCNVFLQPPGMDDPKAIGEQGALGSICFTQTAPGTPPMVLNDGMAKRVPAGWKFVFVLHYQAVGSVQTDQTRLGLIFADPKRVHKEIATRLMFDTELHIPPRTREHRVAQTWEVHRDVLLLSLFPHMHLRGKTFSYELIQPDGEAEILLHVPRYDFNWQHRYLLAEPIRIKAGSKIRCSAVYDNSDENPNNPNPDAEVRAGQQSTDEMFNGYFDVALADEDLQRPKSWHERLTARLSVFGERPGIAVLSSIFGGIYLSRRRLAKALASRS
jgi:peroxiredoxin